MSDFLDRKVRTLFKHLDVNKDGFISLNDLLEVGDRNCDAEKASDVERERTRECITKVWRDWMKFTEAGDDGLLTPAIFAESVKKQRNDPAFKERYKAMCMQYFHVLDVNGDGFLQEDEYARSFIQGGVKETVQVRGAFESMDLNHDGKLTYEEFSTALVEYLTSEDETSPYRELWGPLL